MGPKFVDLDEDDCVEIATSNSVLRESSDAILSSDFKVELHKLEPHRNHNLLNVATVDLIQKQRCPQRLRFMSSFMHPRKISIKNLQKKLYDFPSSSEIGTRPVTSEEEEKYWNFCWKHCRTEPVIYVARTLQKCCRTCVGFSEIALLLEYPTQTLSTFGVSDTDLIRYF
ncbi:hypothetical protein P3S67_029119 [Capsicum chacoense]